MAKRQPIKDELVTLSTRPGEPTICIKARMGRFYLCDILTALKDGASHQRGRPR